MPTLRVSARFRNWHSVLTLGLAALSTVVEVVQRVLGDPDIAAELVVELFNVLDQVLGGKVVPVDGGEAEISGSAKATYGCILTQGYSPPASYRHRYTPR